MLTFEDCLALSDLSEAQIIALAEHEHLPEMLALEYGEYLMHSETGAQELKAMIDADLQRSGSTKNIACLKQILDTYKKAH